MAQRLGLGDDPAAAQILREWAIIGSNSMRRDRSECGAAHGHGRLLIRSSPTET